MDWSDHSPQEKQNGFSDWTQQLPKTEAHNCFFPFYSCWQWIQYCWSLLISALGCRFGLKLNIAVPTKRTERHSIFQSLWETANSSRACLASCVSHSCWQSKLLQYPSLMRQFRIVWKWTFCMPSWLNKSSQDKELEFWMAWMIFSIVVWSSFFGLPRLDVILPDGILKGRDFLFLYGLGNPTANRRW